MSILVLNAGSSTLKFALYNDEAEQEICSGTVDWKGQRESATITLKSPDSPAKEAQTKLGDYGDAVAWVLRTLFENGFKAPIRIVGHRVVHGGTKFLDSVLIADHVNAALPEISKLAPLHHPPVLTTFKATTAALLEIPQVAIFDTSFFAQLPERAFIYPVPYEWYQQYGIRRFGFHGFSHEYCATRAASLLGRTKDDSLRLIICHLGNGCSATATLGGKPIMNTMGFTPLEGLMMGTRSGSIDPGILIHMSQEHGFTAKQLEASLNRSSGLLGVSGVSSDFREVEQAAETGNPRAHLAIEMFADRIRSAIGALAVSLGGVDGLIFTAGIGENSATLRTNVCRGLDCLGLKLNEDLNQNKHQETNSDRDIAAPESAGRILVIRTREEKMVACETHQFLATPSNAKMGN